MANIAGDFYSHIGTVSQAVPAAISQVHRRHMRTRLYPSYHPDCVPQIAADAGDKCFNMSATWFPHDLFRSAQGARLAGTDRALFSINLLECNVKS